MIYIYMYIIDIYYSLSHVRPLLENPSKPLLAFFSYVSSRHPLYSSDNNDNKKYGDKDNNDDDYNDNDER